VKSLEVGKTEHPAAIVEIEMNGCRVMTNA